MTYRREVLQLGGKMLVQMTDELDPEDPVEVANPSGWPDSKQHFLWCHACGTHRQVWEVPARTWLNAWANQINRDGLRWARVIESKKNGHTRLAVWATEANDTRTGS